MKIEIKPFNDLVRFTPAITFKRLKKRTEMTKGRPPFLERCARRKELSPAGLHLNS